jgi:hypothetical protein
MALNMDDLRKTLERTHEVFEKYRKSGFEITATVIFLSGGALAVFRERLDGFEMGLLFLPILTGLGQLFCRYQALKIYAHTRLAYEELRAIQARNATGVLGDRGRRLDEENKRLEEYMEKSNLSRRWFGRADDLSIASMALLIFALAAVVLVQRLPN